MVPPILVASIPCTGTMFTLDLLPGRRGYLHTLQPGEKAYGHLNEPGTMEVIERTLTVVPIRRYRNVQDSWRRRGMDLSELDRLWLLYERLIPMTDVFLLPLEDPRREWHLKMLSKRLDVCLKTDWTPSNHYPKVA